MRKKWFCGLAVESALAFALFSTVSVNAAVTSTVEKWYENGLEKARLSVTDEAGNVVLDSTYASGGSQLSHYTLLKGTGKYFYFVDNGAISAYDNSTGELAWTNYEFGGCPCENCFAVDANDTLYVSGYYGPGLFVADANGNTITNCDINTESHWPYQMTLLADGTLDITYEMEEKTENVDPKAYEGSIDTATGSSMTGTTMKVCNCTEWISLRSVPNANLEAIATIPLGAEVTYFGDAGDGYYQIEYNGICGYAMAKYLE